MPNLTLGTPQYSFANAVLYAYDQRSHTLPEYLSEDQNLECSRAFCLKAFETQSLPNDMIFLIISKSMQSSGEPLARSYAVLTGKIGYSDEQLPEEIINLVATEFLNLKGIARNGQQSSEEQLWEHFFTEAYSNATIEERIHLLKLAGKAAPAQAAKLARDIAIYHKLSKINNFLKKGEVRAVACLVFAIALICLVRHVNKTHKAMKKKEPVSRFDRTLYYSMWASSVLLTGRVIYILATTNVANVVLLLHPTRFLCSLFLEAVLLFHDGFKFTSETSADVSDRLFQSTILRGRAEALELWKGL